MILKILNCLKWILFSMSLLVSAGASTKLYVDDYASLVVGYGISIIMFYIGLYVHRVTKRKHYNI